MKAVRHGGRNRIAADAFTFGGAVDRALTF